MLGMAPLASMTLNTLPLASHCKVQGTGITVAAPSGPAARLGAWKAARLAAVLPFADRRPQRLGPTLQRRRGLAPAAPTGQPGLPPSRRRPLR